ncbi:MAG TPA: hypothetical protein ENO21_04805 [Firmicutes bacterium]|nr:hypothetical protein [Bacillota bacterium]
MRYVVIAAVVLVLLASASAAQDWSDEEAASRADFFAALADGTLTGDALREAQIEQVQNGVDDVQLRVERWYVDNSDGPYPEGNKYPHSVNQLVVPTVWADSMSAYAQPGFYPNPVTAGGPEEFDAVCVPFGWDERSPGNYSYLTAYDEQGIVRDYVIVGYGPTRDSKYDLDGDGLPEGVVLIVSSGELDWDNLPVMYDGGRLVQLQLAELAGGEVVAGPESPPGDQPPKAMGLEVLVQKSKEAKAKQNAYAVQLALERWAVDNPGGFYPQSVNQLLAVPEWTDASDERQWYIEPGFADNPFDEIDGPGMMCVPLGWTTRAPGNVSYLTQHDENGNVFGYQLVCYGLDPDGGLDIDGDGEMDGVLLYMASGMEIVSLPDDPEAFEYYDSGRTVVIR